MKARRVRAFILTLTCACMLCACSVAPRGKTIPLSLPPASSPASTGSPGSLQFTLRKISVLPRESFDQAGYFDPYAEFVFGWLDNDHLAVVGATPISDDAKKRAEKVAQDGAVPEYKLPQKAGAIARMSAKGIVGQILSVDWQTHEAAELHTVQDGAIYSLGLSHDKKSLWYCSTDGEGSSRLSVSDISFKHDMLDVPNFLGSLPVWSSHDKYLYYMEYNSKSRPLLTVFDGVSSRSLPYADFGLSDEGTAGIDDETGKVLSIVKNSLVMSVNLPYSSGDPAAGSRDELLQQKLGGKALTGAIYRTEWSGSDYLLYMVNGKEGNSLNVVSLSSGEQPRSYDGVINYALSNDMRYICLVEEAGGNTADVFVAEWKNGMITNEKLVYKGFVATGPVYFSPDDAKLYVQGRNSYTDDAVTAMVLQFQ